MWDSVWNRVALLAAGMLVGWNLVHYWAAPTVRRRELLIRVAMGGILGLTLVVVLAFVNPGSALLGLIVILFCALVAYAGNARQLLKKPFEVPWLTPDPPAAWQTTPLIYLVGGWEPATYNGPEVWAGVAHTRAAEGQETPHWMAFPRLCGRIRNAYAAMGDVSPTVTALQSLTATVQARLDAPGEVRLITLLERQVLARELRQRFGQGQRIFVFLPLSLPDEAITELRRTVTATRIREAGAVIHYAANMDISTWLGDDRTRLDLLWRGEPVGAPTAPAPALVTSITATINKTLGA